MSNLSNAFDVLRDSIKNINVYRSPYQNPEVDSMIDAFGKITFTKETHQITSGANPDYSWVMRDDAKSVTVSTLPQYANYINFRTGKCIQVSMDGSLCSAYTGGGSSGVMYLYGTMIAPATLILPRYFNGTLNGIVTEYGAFQRGLYLNRFGSNVLLRNSIVNTYHIDRAVEGATVNFDSGYDKSPMYLDRLYLSRKTFGYLASKLGTVTGGKLYLGEKNTSRMSDEQKQKITAKGWEIL